MANVKLGLIVTEIAGTVNGATFRRSASGTVLQKWNSGASKSKLATNLQLAQQSTFVKNWSFLTPTRQSEWNAAALLFQFPDKFGDMRYLSGRQLYLKLAGNMRVVGSPLINLSTIVSTQPTYTSVDTFFDVNGNMTLVFNGSDSFGYFLLQVQPIYDGQNYINWGRSKNLGFIDNSLGNEIDFKAEFLAKYPYVDSRKNFRFYITSMNNYGFRAEAQTYPEEIITPIPAQNILVEGSDNTYISFPKQFTSSPPLITINLYINGLGTAITVVNETLFKFVINTDGSYTLDYGTTPTINSAPGLFVVDNLYTLVLARSVSGFVVSFGAHVQLYTVQVVDIEVSSLFQGSANGSSIGLRDFQLVTRLFNLQEGSGSVLHSNQLTLAELNSDIDVNTLWSNA